MSLSLGVIGLGRIAKVILHSLIAKGQFKPEEVVGVVGQPGTVSGVVKEFPSSLLVLDASDFNARKVWDAPVKILAVKPQQLNQIREQMSSQSQRMNESRPLLISVLAGVKLEKLQSLFPSHSCVRAVPNTPALVGSGLTGLSWGDDVSITQKTLVEKIFDPISEVFQLPEVQLDAFLALTSSGPAYLALIAEALADGAVAAGLPRHLAYKLTHLTLEGTSLLLKEKDLHPSELKDMVASPAGTTIRAIRHLEKEGVRSALIEAVVLAAQKSRELGNS